MRLRLSLVLALGAILSARELPKKATALDRWVAAPDPAFAFKEVTKTKDGAVTVHLLDMTSQSWRSAAEINRTKWTHWVTIFRPDQIKHSTAFLFITGGANNNQQPRPDAFLRDLAASTGSVTVELRMVPNQPVIFAGETKGRTEDSLIAYSWDKFLRGGDDQWPARLPMTKSATAAMDTVQQFLAKPENGGVKIEKFVVSGASKRGWTTWTAAAVDPRVSAIIPLVIDMLNLEKSFDHHYRVYGFYAPAVKDYEDMKIMDWAGAARYRELLKIEEPYEYRERLTMPKLIINAAGDQFFLPDSSQFYFGDLKGEKYLRYVPNVDHSMRNSDVRESISAYYEALLNQKPRPRFTWNIDKKGEIKVKTEDAPSEVKLWAATNPDARDFRLEKIGPAYKATVLAETKKGVYVAKPPQPAKGFTAYFVELTYPSGGKNPFKFTTGVKVIPDTYPHGPYVTKPLN